MAALKHLQQLRACCVDRAHRPFLVGGFLRDALLGRSSHDLDLAVADPDELARELAAALDGTLVTLDPERRVYRVVVADPDGRWQIDVALLAGTIEEDLGGRDFTIDAMAVPLGRAEGDPEAWPVVDPRGGRSDLAGRLVRAAAPSVFVEDPVRLLRALRLSAELGFDLEPETRSRIEADARLIVRVSGERVREELLTILGLPGVGRSLAALSETGLLDALLPELAVGRGVQQPKEHYWDVFDHNLQCVAMAERLLDPALRDANEATTQVPWEPWTSAYFSQEAGDGHTRGTFLKLAALLHDVAKPQTRTFEPSGRMRFFGHATEGAQTAEGILRRLRVNSRGVSRVSRMIEEHLRPSQIAQPGELPTARAVYRYFRDVGDVAVDTLYLNLADYLAARGPTLDLEDWGRHCERIAYTLEKGFHTPDPQRAARLVTGHDLTRVFGLGPGPLIGTLLEQVREAQATGQVQTREEALHLLRELVSNARVATGENRAAS